MSLLIGYPVFTIVLSVRLVMTPAFLHFEYTRPDFPADFYGMTVEDRLTYAPHALIYLVEMRPLDYLADLQFPDGTPLFNARELHHMRDVQIVTAAAFSLGITLGGLIAIVSVALLRAQRTHDLLSALRTAALLTLSLIALIVILAIASWDFFFVTFHRLFFADGTWVFAYSDTLIRLFPERFWFDAALAVGSISVILSVVTLILTSAALRWIRSHERHKPSVSFDIATR
ncbi:MAG: TIGR01906 family membrane protein [Anaerolinea sp.]|nr:TIGR01906 family membrane protein [Anaerolinea sp.]